MQTATSVHIEPIAGDPVRSNPFPGLRPFREDEEYLFFGRENQVDAMVNKLAATRFLAVVGTSGSGKSSLVNCGLRPALHGGLMASAGTSWRMGQFRPGSDPLRAMADALASDGVLFRDYQAGGLTLAEIVETTLRMSKLGLIDIYEQAKLGEDVNLLVVVDQFEELFRYRQVRAGQQESVADIAEQATAFVNLLLEATQQTTCRIYVVLTMRSDFLGDCAQFPGLAEAINAGQYLVPRMTREERRAAITGPVGVGGAEISPVLLTRLVNDVGDNPDQLSILQHALNRTWARWQHEGGTGPLDMAHYEAIGTMAHALDQHAERAYAELDNVRRRGLCEKIFKALTDKATDPRGVRRPSTLGTLCALADATAAEVTAVIDVFRQPSRSFLMPPAGEALETATVVDISHESLMRVWQRLNAWADEEAQSAQTYRRLTDTAALHAAGKAGLWRDPDLTYARDWQARELPNATWAARYAPGFDDACAFLRDSEAAHAAELEEERKQAAEREATREKELRAARTLAEERDRRLIEATRRAGMQRRMSTRLGWLLMLSLALTVFSILQWREATKQRDSANLARLEATTQRDSANLARLEATKQRDTADAARLAAQAQWKLDEHFDEALLLATEGAQRVRTPETTQALLAVLARLPSQRPFLRGHAGSVATVAFSRRRGLLATGSDDGTVILWDVTTRQPAGAPLEGHADPVTSVAFSPDGTLLATGSKDTKVILWDMASRQPVGAPLEGHRYPVTSVAFSPDGTLLATGSKDRTVVLWNVASRQPVGAPLQGQHKYPVTSVAFSPDGTLLATGSEDKTAILWNVASRQPVGSPLKGHTDVVTSLAFSPDGTLLATGSDDKTVILWNVASRQPVGAPLEGHSSSVTSVGFSPDGTLLATGSHDKTVILRDVASRQPVGVPLQEHEGWVTSVAFSPDGTLLATGSEDTTAILWTVTTRQPAAGAALEGHKKGEVTSLAFAPGEKLLATGSSDKTAILWDVTRRQPVGAPLQGHKDWVTSVAFSPDGKVLATGSRDKTAILWDVTNHQPVGVPLQGHEDWVTSVAFSPDGKLLATGSKDKTVILWDVASRQRVGRPLEGHEDSVTSLAFSPDGKLLATGGGDLSSESGNNPVLVWDLATRQQVGAPLKGHTFKVNSLAFSPDGTLLATGSDDTTAILWDVASGQQVGALLPGHTNSVTSLAFSPDGKLLATGSNDKTVILWDVASRSRVGDPVAAGHEQPVTAVAFSPSGKLLALGLAGSVPLPVPLLWDLENPSWASVGCAVAARNLSCSEWRDARGEEAYRKTCAALPAPTSCERGRDAGASEK